MVKNTLIKFSMILFTFGIVSSTFAAIDQDKAQTEKFVLSAIDYAKTKGKDVAIKDFNNQNGQFEKGTSYIFAIDYTGLFLANPNDPEYIGKNEYDLKDSKGKYVIRDLIEKAKQGGGWVSYYWKNPKTQKDQCKVSYVMPMDDYLIGSGYYTSDKNCK